MTLAWARPAIEPAEMPGWEKEAPARVDPSRPWVLFIGADESALLAAARAFAWERAGLPAVQPPRDIPLPVAVHRLAAPDIEGERLLFAPRIDTGFGEGPFCPTSPLYLLALLSRKAASDGKFPLSIVATALESKARDSISQRGLWSRFEIRRVPGPATTHDAGVDDVRAACEGLLERREPDSGLACLFASSRLAPREAEPLLRKAVALEPELPAAHYELGKALIRNDDMEGALDAFRRTTELLPEYASAWGNLGAALGEVQKLDESTRALGEAVALDPLNHALHSNLGVAYRDQGRLDEAELRFAQALELAPDFVFGHYNLASVLFLSDRYAEAIAAFERARKLDTSVSPRQSLLLAATRLASGDVAGAFKEYRDAFARLDPQMKPDMRTVAEWDLKQLAQRKGVSQPLREAVELVKSLA